MGSAGPWITVALIVLCAWFVWRTLPRSQRPEVRTIPRIRGRDEFSVEVVGESFYADAFHTLIKRLRPDDLGDEWFGDAMLVLEEDNPHDAMAVGVHIDGLKIGHLSREMARDFRRAIKRDKLSQYREFAIGARLYFGGDNERHSVSLDLPEA